MMRFRYKPEGPEAKAWRNIALRVEKENGAYGLCYATNIALNLALVNDGELVDDKIRNSVSSRIALFGDGPGFRWPIVRIEDHRGKRTDRITAAWLCYWMAREEGA